MYNNNSKLCWKYKVLIANSQTIHSLRATLTVIVCTAQQSTPPPFPPEFLFDVILDIYSFHLSRYLHKLTKGIVQKILGKLKKNFQIKIHLVFLNFKSN